LDRPTAGGPNANNQNIDAKLESEEMLSNITGTVVNALIAPQSKFSVRTVSSRPDVVSVKPTGTDESLSGFEAFQLMQQVVAECKEPTFWWGYRTNLLPVALLQRRFAFLNSLNDRSLNPSSHRRI